MAVTRLGKDPRQALPRTLAVIEQGLAQGVQIGAQVYVSLRGECLGDFGIGEARRGVPMTPDSLMLWWSSTKAVTTVAIAQMWEKGRLDMDDRIAQHIPEFGNKGKEAVTLRHVLTHTGGFPQADWAPGTAAPGMSPFIRSWEETIARICAAEIEPGWVPGKKAGYHPTSGWFVLGEIVRRLSGRPFSQYVREEIFQPLGMTDCWIGMPPERYRDYGDRIGLMHNTEGDQPMPVAYVDTEEGVSRCVPGASGRGPMAELGRLYEVLLGRGQLGEARLLSPQTVAAITARHRVGMVDQTFGVVVDWGLGLIVDAFAFGRHSSPRAFGHGGAFSSNCFCDPEHGLVVAAVMNGMTTAEKHYVRFDAISTAVYEDLGLAAPGSPGRQREAPASGLT